MRALRYGKDALIISNASRVTTEDVSLNYVGDFVGDFAPRTYVSMREIVEF